MFANSYLTHRKYLFNNTWPKRPLLSIIFPEFNLSLLNLSYLFYNELFMKPTSKHKRIEN